MSGEATVRELVEPFEIRLKVVSEPPKVIERAVLIFRGGDAPFRPVRIAPDGAEERR